MTDKGGDSPQSEASWAAPSSESSSSSHSTGYSVCYFFIVGSSLGIYIYIYIIYINLGYRHILPLIILEVG